MIRVWRTSTADLQDLGNVLDLTNLSVAGLLCTDLQTVPVNTMVHLLASAVRVLTLHGLTAPRQKIKSIIRLVTTILY